MAYDYTKTNSIVRTLEETKKAAAEELLKMETAKKVLLDEVAELDSKINYLHLLVEDGKV